MSVKITSTGIDTIQDNTVHTTNIVDNGISHDDMPIGSNLQIKFNNSNNNWGSVGNNSVFELTQADVTLTTIGDNSSFLVNGQVSTNDTNSNSFGTGVGLRLYIDGSLHSEPIQSARHETYLSGGYDTYRVAKHTTLITSTFPRGTTITFRMTTRFNNSNGTFFGGNGSPYYSTRQAIQEIKT